MKNVKLIILGLLLLTSCQNQSTSSISESADSLTSSANEPVDSIAYTQDDQVNIRRLIGMTLTSLFQEDLEAGFIDSLSRQYRYNQVDLNQDGKRELLVGLIGPNFCGTGGCTVLLLTYHGDVITQFTVVDYPVYIDTEATNGWNNLIMYSGSKNRKVTFDGESYPTNPSLLEIYLGSTETLTKILDYENQEMYKF